MQESIIITLFLMIIVIYYTKKQKSIIFFSKLNIIKIIIYTLLSFSILIIFWPAELENQIKLIDISIMILLVGSMREGITSNGVLKFGLIDGKFDKFQSIEIKKVNSNKTNVIFHKKKNDNFLMTMDYSYEDILNYFLSKKEKNNEIVVS